MNFKEKVAQDIHDALVEMEQKLTSLVQAFVVESFKNGVETGKGRQAEAGGGSTFRKNTSAAQHNRRNAAEQESS